MVSKEFYSIFNEQINIMKFTLAFIIIVGICGYSNAQEQTVDVPEPLMFDLVRGLGAKQGELEINTLADFPLNNAGERSIEWAPEIEYALFDGFAIEAEFPFEDEHLEAFKVALQYTLGQSKSNKFIHGLQFISEMYRFESITELSLLYIPAYRFNGTWSILGLYGLMYETGSDAASKDTTVLLNTTIFANISDQLVLGFEINNTDPTLQKRDDNEMELLLLPQCQYQLKNGFEIQVGLGPRFAENDTELSGVLRVIKSF